MARALRDPREVSIDEVVAQLRILGVETGDVLLVHTSFRAVRPVERGPAGLIDALGLAIGPRGTLVMPAWTGDNDRPFDPVTTPASPDLGVVADTFRQLPGVERSAHAFAFAARGPDADRIVSDPLVLPPHQHRSPVGRVLDCDGRILLLGVDHDANTTLHLAELLANVPYRIAHHITVLDEGTPTRIDYLENDHCCQLFKRLDEWLDPCALQTRGTVGHAPARLARSRHVIDAALAELEADPFVFLHPKGSGCEECSDAWRSVPA